MPPSLPHHPGLDIGGVQAGVGAEFADGDGWVGVLKVSFSYKVQVASYKLFTCRWQASLLLPGYSLLPFSLTVIAVA
jgi:hypothetical protein